MGWGGGYGGVHVGCGERLRCAVCGVRCVVETHGLQRGSAVTGRRRTHLEHLLEHRSLGLLLHALKDGALLLRGHLGVEWYGDRDGDGGPCK